MTRPLTVIELVGYLSVLPDDMPVVASYDTGICHDDVWRVQTSDFDGVECVVLTVGPD